MATLLEGRFRKRTWYLFAFVTTIAAGLASRRSPQVVPACLGKYPGDALWALMVFLGMGTLFSKAPSLQLGFGALGFCFGIETLKLYQAPWLVNARHTTLGHLVFGQVFSWQNLLAYTVGVLVGLVLEGLVLPNRRGSGGDEAG